LRTFSLSWPSRRLIDFGLLRRTHIMTKQHSLVSLFFDRLILHHPGIVILCALVVVGLLALGARYFRLDASAETLVMENDKDLRYAIQISDRYGQSDFLVLTYTPKASSIFSPDTLKILAKLRDDLSALDDVESVRSILDVPLLENPPVSLKNISADLPTLESPGVDIKSAAAELSQSPLCRDLLLSADSRTTALLINFAGDRFTAI
jgi:predicted RND superfamily exporter protein